MTDGMPTGSIQLHRKGYVSWFRVTRSEDWSSVLRRVLALPEVAGCNVKLLSWDGLGWRETLQFQIPF